MKCLMTVIDADGMEISASVTTYWDFCRGGIKLVTPAEMPILHSGLITGITLHTMEGDPIRKAMNPKWTRAPLAMRPNDVLRMRDYVISFKQPKKNRP